MKHNAFNSKPDRKCSKHPNIKKSVEKKLEKAGKLFTQDTLSVHPG